MLDTIDIGLLYKCKIPTNHNCNDDNECPYKNKCIYGKCKGFLNALCKDNSECFVSNL